MLTLELSFADLLRCRFAISPVNEVVELARAIATPPGRAAHSTWLRQRAAPLQRVAGRHDLRPLFALLHSCEHTPEFLRPLPKGAAGEIDLELAQIGCTEDERVQAEIDRCVAAPGQIERDVARALRSRGAAQKLAELLSSLWGELVSPSWRRIRDCLERDILHRSRSLASGGLAAVFDDLAPPVMLEDRRLLVHEHTDRVRSVDGAGLVLMPSTFIPARLAAILDASAAPVGLCYPARGRGAIWFRPPCNRPDGLPNLIGSTRSQTLQAIDEPMHTTALARQLGRSPGNVSGHLAVLKQSGLVRGTGVGLHVRYVRTQLGEALLRGAAEMATAA